MPRAIASDVAATLQALQSPGVTEIAMVVNGRSVEAADGRWIEVESPRNRQLIGRAPRGSTPDVDAAVSAASQAFPRWRATPPRERGAALIAAANALEPVAEELARIMSLENGNALRTQSRGEVRFILDVLRYFGGVAQEAKGETLPTGGHTLEYSHREPLGVVGAIIPWNAPLQLATLKIAPAIATGNTVVLKVSEQAPIAVLELARICDQFLPPGVINVINGYGAEAGEALINDSRVRKLSFTGSTPVGRHVMEAAARRIVPVSLELGGKSPQIVFPDADQDWVADGVIAAMRFARQGQSCTAGSRLLLHRAVFDSFMSRLVERLAKLTVGDPLEDASDIGAVINQAQFDKICGYIQLGLDQPGARVLLGGLPPSDGPLAAGYFIEPTIFTDLDVRSPLAREEVFGPVLSAVPFTDEHEAISLANDSEYGLAAYVWTTDLGRALRTADALEAGWIQVNKGGGQAVGQSYGGMKQSGIGREVSLEAMLESFTERKHVSVELAR